MSSLEAPSLSLQLGPCNFVPVTHLSLLYLNKKQTTGKGHDVKNDQGQKVEGCEGPGKQEGGGAGGRIQGGFRGRCGLCFLALPALAGPHRSGLLPVPPPWPEPGTEGHAGRGRSCSGPLTLRVSVLKHPHPPPGHARDTPISCPAPGLSPAGIMAPR